MFSVFPFALLRFYQERWLHASIDLAIVVMIIGLTYLAKKRSEMAFFISWFASAGYIFAVWVTVANYESYTMLWIFPISVALYFILSPRNAFFTNIIFLAGVWFFIAEPPSMPEMITYSFVVLLVNIFTLQFSSSLYRDNQALTLLSNQDPLTGIGNRRSLDSKLKTLETEKPENYSLMMLDLDHFKKVNDSYGHNVGDELLRQLVAFLTADKNRLNSHVVDVYRFGGEEFCLLIQKPLEPATAWAKELCHAVEKEFEGSQIPITVSIGITAMKPDASIIYWLRAADEALYAAKQNGRNQVKVYQDGHVY